MDIITYIKGLGVTELQAWVLQILFHGAGRGVGPDNTPRWVAEDELFTRINPVLLSRQAQGDKIPGPITLGTLRRTLTQLEKKGLAEGDGVYYCINERLIKEYYSPVRERVAGYEALSTVHKV